MSWLTANSRLSWTRNRVNLKVLRLPTLEAALALFLSIDGMLIVIWG